MGLIMRRFQVALLDAVATIGFASVALAADMPVKAPVYKAAPAPMFNWSGFYVGGNVGGHWGSDSDPAVFGVNDWFGGGADTSAAANAWPHTLKPSGFAGGGQVGYNWQISNFVFGAEADIFGLTGTSSRNVTFPLNGGTGASFVGDSASVKWMATLRARGGLAFDRVLLYVTGGAAFSNWSINHTYSDTVGATPTNVTNSTTRTGWTVGAGLEYALTNNWTLRGEYLYADFGTFNNSLTMNAPPSGFTVLHPDRLTENIGRAAINYKF